MDASIHARMQGKRMQMAAGIRTAQQQMADVRATAESDDGHIVATVDAAHELVELWLDPRIYRTPDSTALAKAIMSTVSRAARIAQEEAFAILRNCLPAKATPETTDLRFDPLLTALEQTTPSGDHR